jgi:hypothetical protein
MAQIWTKRWKILVTLVLPVWANDEIRSREREHTRPGRGKLLRRRRAEVETREKCPGHDEARVEGDEDRRHEVRVVGEALELPNPVFGEALLDRTVVAATEEVRREDETEYTRDGGEDETTDARDGSSVRHSYLRILPPLPVWASGDEGVATSGDHEISARPPKVRIVSTRILI